MKDLLNHLFSHNSLSSDQAKSILTEISEGKHNEAQVAAFISVFLMRNISVDELKGFTEALLELRVPLDFGDIDAIDLCGTGGDGKNTFNISTLTSLVVAGAGYFVTKHGNYGVSSICGSSNVLESLGYKFSNNKSTLEHQLESSNICFLHAPLFHPAMKFVGPIRKQLGIKTFFNMLGPLVNPAQPNHQMTGVFSLHLQRLYQYLLQDSDINFNIVFGLSGFDEISLTDKAQVISRSGIRHVDYNYFKTDALKLDQIHGGDTIEEACDIFISVLKNKCTTAHKNVVLANAALAIQTFNQEKDIMTCWSEAEESLNSGKAFDGFIKIIEISQAA